MSILCQILWILENIMSSKLKPLVCDFKVFALLKLASLFEFFKASRIGNVWWGCSIAHFSKIQNKFSKI